MGAIVVLIGLSGIAFLLIPSFPYAPINMIQAALGTYVYEGTLHQLGTPLSAVWLVAVGASLAVIAGLGSILFTGRGDRGASHGGRYPMTVAALAVSLSGALVLLGALGALFQAASTGLMLQNYWVIIECCIGLLLVLLGSSL